MNLFDKVIQSKLSQLHEAEGMTTGVAQATPAAPAPAQAGTATPQATAPNTPQATNDTSQTAQQAKPEGTEQALSKVFQTMKFSDSKTTLNALNNALKTSGNVPGIKEFFSSLAFDPKAGFTTVQQNQSTKAPAPAQGAPQPPAQ
jgi:hypothetical protein